MSDLEMEVCTVPENSKQVGSYKISQDVLVTIAQIAAYEIKGVLAVSNVISGIRGLLNRASYAKPIRVETDGDQVNFEIPVIVEKGISIPALAKQLQENIKRSVESMTGLSVGAVNVVIAGLAESVSKQGDEYDEA